MTPKKVSLGRMAVFLLPVLKLETHAVRGIKLKDAVHGFLLSKFNSYTAQDGHIFGYWRDPRTDKEHYDVHRTYKVSFEGKDRIPLLEKFLADVATEIEEECIYLETGEDAWLIYPEENRTQGKKVCKKP